MAEIQFKNVTKYFGQTKVIDNLNLRVKEAEFIVLVGPSGCGKSTTLRLLAGLEEVTSGEILMDGKIVNNIAPKDRDISMVFQNYALYPHMTVYNNMAFGLKLKKYEKVKINKRVQETSEILGLRDFLQRKPKQLSGGQRQRVALGRAIVRKPKVFLFDEPLSNLDAKLRVQMRTEIKKLHQQLKTTMIYVTHDQVEAMTMGDRIVVIKDGVIHQMGSPTEIYRHPTDMFVAEFIGSPAMNFISGVVQNGVFRSNDGAIELPIRDDRFRECKERAIVMGIRPEGFLLSKSSKQLKSCSLKLEVLEPMGNESILYFSKGENQIVCRSQKTEISTSIGENMPVYIDMERVHFFDISTGKAI